MFLASKKILKLDSFKSKPNWRYLVLKEPRKSGFGSLINDELKDGDGALKRFISAGLNHKVNYKVPDELRKFSDKLDPAEARTLIRLWDRAFKRQKKKKVTVYQDQTIFKNNYVWNSRKVEEINDPFLRKAIQHVNNTKYDEYISSAFKLYHSTEYSEIVRFIGYSFYAKVEDTKVAVRWNLPVGVITALRLLFFDFSAFPKDRVANFTFLRQAVLNDNISEQDFAFYKRVYELGELGVKAQVDYFSLTEAEKNKIKEFLGASFVSSTLNLNFAIQGTRDTKEYTQSLSALGDYFIKQEEVSHIKSRVRNLEASTRKLEGEMSGVGGGITDIDATFLALLKEQSFVEPPFEFKTTADLNSL